MSMAHLNVVSNPLWLLAPKHAAIPVGPLQFHAHSLRVERTSTQSPTVCKASSGGTTVRGVGGLASTVWTSFADAASGEWEGVTASFNPDGTPVPLPEYYVPQAYRDWGVELYDWQSQCSMLADGSGLLAATRRMMPTVGCEADAIAFTQQAEQLFGPDSPCIAVAEDGSYSWGGDDGCLARQDARKASFEQCLVLQHRQRRLRVMHSLQRGQGPDSQWQLAGVDLHLERYESPYRGKLELSGCGGGMKGFASEPRLDASTLQGAWVAHGVRYSADDTGRYEAQAVSCVPWSLDAWATAMILHPLNAWTSCSIAGSDVHLAAGVVQHSEDGDSMALITRQLAAGRLAAAELLTLRRL